MNTSARLLNDYLVGETLGVGGFSFVKLGIHKDTKERVALKCLKKDKLSLSATHKKQVEREIEALSKIQHKNVIRLKHVDWNAQYELKDGHKLDIILTVLELANGGELFEFLSHTGAFEETLARTYFKQLIDGVDYMHTKKVVHRDLKPENLLLDENFVLKIADFGFAGVFSESSSSTNMTTECGTPGYMAPEVFNPSTTGTKGYDAMISDIWSCGVILFIMLAGFPPFQRPAMTDWWFNKLATNKHNLFWQAHCRSAFFSNDAKDFLNKVLCPEPAKRMTIEQMKKHAWFTGTTLTDTQLVQELTRRKNTVDEEKRQAEEQKQRESCAESARSASSEFDPNSVAMRDMPSAPPSFNLFNARPVRLQQMAISSSLSDPLASSSTSSATSGKAAELKLTPYSAAANVACYTKFESKAEGPRLYNRVLGALQALGAKIISEKPSKCFLKARATTVGGNVTLIAKVYQNASDTGKRVVVFRRRQGDGCSYRDVYFYMRQQLTDLILKSETAKTTETATTASSTSSVTASSAAATKSAPITVTVANTHATVDANMADAPQ